MAFSARNVFLIALGVIGTYGTWGLCLQDGSLGYILKAVFIDDEPYLLPGTKEPLLKNLTGIWPLDRLLAILILFFWQAADGSHPATSAVGLYFAGQHLGLVASMYLDSLRIKNMRSRRWKLDPTVWTFLFQLLAIGVAGPAYAALLPTTPFTTDTYSDASTIAASESAATLPLSCLLGYVLPAIAMAARTPSALASPRAKQLGIVAWNIFPLWIALLQSLLPRLALPLLHRFSSPPARRSTAPPRISHRRAAYALAILAATLSHVAVAAAALAAPALFPTLFAPGVAGALGLAVFSAAPPSPAAVERGDIGDAVRRFMLWDQAVGYAVMLFVAAERLARAARRAGTEERGGWGWVLEGMAIAGGCVVVGPAAVVLGAQWVAEETEAEAAAEPRGAGAVRVRGKKEE